jgi:hypothetical protein
MYLEVLQPLANSNAAHAADKINRFIVQLIIRFYVMLSLIQSPLN